MSEPESDFRALYSAQFDAILGYALRRTAPEDAADIVAETFLVAWRRQAEIPPGDAARLWLYGVARRVLANHLRGEGRRTRLGDRLRDELAHRAVTSDLADDVVETQVVRAAMAQLRELDRELLELSVWEGLDPREIAVTLQVSGVVVRTRLRRARARLRHLLEDAWPSDRPPGSASASGPRHDPAPPGHVPGVRSQLVPKEDR